MAVGDDDDLPSFLDHPGPGFREAGGVNRNVRTVQPVASPLEAAKSAGREKPHYWGHRQRVRDRFAAGGAESMPDYEIVEMLLFNAIPKRDVKPLAKRLLEDFGGIERLLTAGREELQRHPDVDHWIVHHFKLAEAVAIRLAKARLTERPLMDSMDRVREYLRTRLAHSNVEHFRVLFLDVKHRMIADEEFARGTVNHTPVYPREVVKRALELSASGVILVHNHPSGDPRPSAQDLSMTQLINSALGTVDIALYDHIIVGQSDEVSLRELDALD